MIVAIVTLNALFAAGAVGGVLTLLGRAIVYGPREDHTRGNPQWPARGPAPPAVGRYR